MHDDFASDYLPWFRDVMDGRWRNQTPAKFEDGFQRGTKWRGGLSAAEIEGAEARFGFRFPPDYRQFLALLHTPDPPEAVTEFDGGEPVRTTRRRFPDWIGDPQPIWDAIAWPIEGLLWSIETEDGWFTSWGPRPRTAEGRAERVRQLAADGPQVVPVYGHRYLVGPPDRAGNPVLSMYGADVIVYGGDLEDYLRRELGLPSQEERRVIRDEAALGLWADVMAGFDVHR
jgi:hypothetical protein